MRKLLALLIVLTIFAAPAVARDTPASIVAAYGALADTILALRESEAAFVRSFLDGHLHAAKQLRQKGDWQGAAAEMALFANEGDNAIGGVRKRLLEGGHHFNAAGEEAGEYEEGYVVVTREAKQKILDLAKAIRQATDDTAREAAWKEFKPIAQGLLGIE